MAVARDNTKYKIIVSGIKDIVTDGRGRMTYMDQFDSCIDEIFGVPHFSRKINGAYSNKEIIDIIERVGSEYLYDIFTNKRLRGILTEMTKMDKRIHVLRKDLRKQGKRGGRDKYDLKEYNWLRKTFKESAKYMRNRFGIKNNKTAYKRRYKNISEVLKNRDDDDYGFDSFTFGGYDDFDDYNDRSYNSYNDDYYEDDDYEDTSELQDFEMMMNGRKNNRSRSRRSRNSTRKSRYDFDDEWDDSDSFDDEDDDKFVDDDLEKKVNKIADNVMYLADAVQFLNNKSNYDSARIRNLRDYAVKDMRRNREESASNDDHWSLHDNYKKPHSNTTLETEIGIITDFVEKLGEDVTQLKKNNNLFVDALNKIINQNSEIVETFNAIFDDDDATDDSDDINYSVEGAFTKPKVVSKTLDDLVNHIEDPYDHLDDEDDAEVSTNSSEIGGTVRELVDQINKSNDKPVVTVEAFDVKEAPAQ